MAGPWYSDKNTHSPYTQGGPSHRSLEYECYAKDKASRGCPWGWLAESCQTITAMASKGPLSPVKSISINVETQYYQMSSPSRPLAPYCGKNYSWQPLGHLIKCNKKRQAEEEWRKRRKKKTEEGRKGGRVWESKYLGRSVVLFGWLIVLTRNDILTGVEVKETWGRMKEEGLKKGGWYGGWEECHWMKNCWS